MVSWLTEIFQQTARFGQHATLGALLLVATLVLSFGIALAILICLPSDYFCAPRTKRAQDAGRSIVVAIVVAIGVVLKNLLGAILIVIGVVLSVPGMPGQGLLTVLAGICLADFPGKRWLLYKILGRAPLLRAINRLRTKFSRPPLVAG
jgi:hypothetical protein